MTASSSTPPPTSASGGSRALLLFALGARKLAIPVASVLRVVPAVEITPLPNAPAPVRGIINVQGAIVPVYDLHQRLGLPVRPVACEDFLILARNGSRDVALLADEICGVAAHPGQQPSGSSVQNIAPGSEAVALAGEIVLIQDLDQFLSASEDATLQQAIERRNAGVNE